MVSKIAPCCMMQGRNDSKDRQLMQDKITFMAGLADHENIVKFIASCNDVDEGIKNTCFPVIT